MTSLSGLPAPDDAASAPGDNASRPPDSSLYTTGAVKPEELSRNANPPQRSATTPTKREQILTAAERATQRYCLSKATMDDIGREAGISQPTLYRYFSSRNNLLGALIDRRLRMLFDRARATACPVSRRSRSTHPLGSQRCMHTKKPIIIRIMQCCRLARRRRPWRTEAVRACVAFPARIADRPSTGRNTGDRHVGTAVDEAARSGPD